MTPVQIKILMGKELDAKLAPVIAKLERIEKMLGGESKPQTDKKPKSEK